MQFTITTILALAATALAAPAPSTGETVPSNTGALTWYNPGLGACGQTNGDDDLIVAVSAALYDSQSQCNKNIRISHDGRTVDVKVVDRCAGCAENDLDLSPAAFEKVVGDLGVGRTTGTWEFI